MSEELKERLRLVPRRTYPMPVMLALFEESLNRIEELEAKAERLSGLLAFAVEMTGEPDCYPDHHGYCQAHNLQPRGECWVELANKELKGQADE